MAETNLAPGRLERATKRLFVVVSVAILPAVVVLITADTVLRYVFARPIVWAQDAAGIGLFLVFCAGLPYSWFARFHVRMDMIYLRLGAVPRRAVDIVGAAAALVFGGMLAYRATIAAMIAFRNESTMPSGVIPLWPFQAAGAGFLMLFCLAMIVPIFARGRAGSD
jgi:TRAP-type C4-dicarboxylate transport system permease small subunit